MKAFLDKLLIKTQRFMTGRYGFDQLSLALLALTLVFALLGSFTGSLILSLLGPLCLILCYYRAFSKKLYKRQQENYKFLHRWYPVRDWFEKKYARLKGMKTHKYFKCKNCKQTLRVPRGRGKLVVTCPKCKTEVHKKS